MSLRLPNGWTLTIDQRLETLRDERGRIVSVWDVGTVTQDGVDLAQLRHSIKMASNEKGNIVE